MLSRVVIKNFKSIGGPGVDLELKPLTLLVGPNGSGKSSILEAIAVASQHQPQGKLTTFPSWESIVHKQSRSTLSVEVFSDQSSQDIKPHLRLSFGESPSRTSREREPIFERLPGWEQSSALENELRSKSFLIAASRGDVPYSVDQNQYPQWIGVNGENLVASLKFILSNPFHKAVARKIGYWAGHFGMDDLKAGLRPENVWSSDYQDSALKTLLDLALASSGSKQILTVITQLFWALEGSLLMIEEPEISLHPKGQIDVLEMFAEAIREDDKQIIATTHSNFLLQALGYAVFKGWLTPEQIAVYHVEKDAQGTKAQSLPLDENGYIKGWVPSFTDIERQLLLEWAKSLPRE